jgi:3-oxoacyl-[acyl-carrier protein] reductase
MRLQGKHIVITGSSRGLGRAMAERFASEGARLALCARSPKPLEELRLSLVERGCDVVAFPCDISNSQQTKAFADTSMFL